MRVVRNGLVMLVVWMVAPLGGAGADNPCPPEPAHTYVGAAEVRFPTTLVLGRDVEAGVVAVTDTSTSDCNPMDGVPGDWDGDYDFGVGGGFFGYGAWVDDADCDYQLHTHSGDVSVVDAAFGSSIAFVVAENDQDGPVKVPDGEGGYSCATDDMVLPGLDPDDCVSPVFVGSGSTCGSGGGDGGYWVYVRYECLVDGQGAGPPTAGVIVAGGSGAGATPAVAEPGCAGVEACADAIARGVPPDRIPVQATVVSWEHTGWVHDLFFAPKTTIKVRMTWLEGRPLHVLSLTGTDAADCSNSATAAKPDALADPDDTTYTLELRGHVTQVDLDVKVLKLIGVLLEAYSGRITIAKP